MTANFFTIFFFLIFFLHFIEKISYTKVFELADSEFLGFMFIRLKVFSVIRGNTEFSEKFRCFQVIKTTMISRSLMPNFTVIMFIRLIVPSSAYKKYFFNRCFDKLFRKFCIDKIFSFNWLKTYFFVHGELIKSI